ncbi:MAG: Pr6Pr family membrane protein [Clostridia bacterium]|nr:Pr6Pr family membrane protein [Clostridia bacterium]
MKEKTELNKSASNKVLGVILLTFAVFGFLVFIHRLCYYNFEYDPEYSPVDYGKYNILSYFTVQSNFFCYIYFLLAGLGILGAEKARKIGFNPVLGALVTLYVIIAGITYTAGIPMGMTPPFKWDTPAHSMSSFIQVYYHMIMPPVAFIVWLFPFTNEKLTKKTVLLSGIYPFVYSVFSIIRGAFSDPVYYPYPFYNPEFIGSLFKPEPLSKGASYAVIGVLLIFGIGLFMACCALIVLVHNKRIKKIPEEQK